MTKKNYNKLPVEEQLKIINADPVLWCGNFIKIVDNNNNLVKFKFNDAQKDFVRNKSRFNIICKTRQLGMSTMMLGMMLWVAHTMPNSQCLMVADKGESTQNLFNRLKMMYESIPDDIKVEQRRSNKYELFLENGSRISVQTAGNKELGRSFSCQIIHLSEFAFWSDEVQERGLISLEQALAKNKDAFLCIESTSNGIGNKYYDIFTNAQKGESKYKPFFYGWGSKVHREMFKNEIDEAVTWAKGLNHGERYILNKLYFYPEELELHEKYGVTANQLLWRRYKMRDIGEDAFNQEFPINPEVSFIQTDTGFFSALDITNRYKYLPKPLNQKEIGVDLPEILLKYFGNGFYIFQPIKSTETYFGGVDSSAGLKGDYSAISIFNSSGEQVAVFYRNDVPIYKFAKICFELGHLFNYCMLAIERNSYGLSLIDKLRREMQYLQVLRFNKFDKIRGILTSEYGYYTDNVSKTKLLNDFKEVFEEGIVLINDRETLDEMKIYIETKKGSLGNIKGNKNHDDLVDASSLAIQALKKNVSYL